MQFTFGVVSCATSQSSLAVFVIQTVCPKPIWFILTRVKVEMSPARKLTSSFLTYPPVFTNSLSNTFVGNGVCSYPSGLL